MKRSFLIISNIITIITIMNISSKKLNAYSINRIGNSVLAIDLSLGIPLFTHDLSKAYPLNIYPGGLGALNYQYYILDNLSLGFELRYIFNFDINFSISLLNPDSSTGKTFFSVPITFLINYVYDINEMFQIPIFTNLGIALNSYGRGGDNISNLRTFDVVPVISIGSGFFWNINHKWALGTTTSWWMMFEAGKSAKSGHFLLVSLTVKVNLFK